MMAVAALLVPACREADVDIATGTCAAVMWVPQSSILPELTIEGAQLISASILGLWAVAYVFRLIRKSIK